MGRLKKELCYEDRDYNDSKIGYRRNKKNEKKNLKFKPNKRTRKNHDFHTEKESQTNTAIIQNMLNKISAGSGLGLEEGSKRIYYRERTGATSDKEQKMSYLEAFRNPSPEDVCKMLGLKFVTSNEMVLKLFNAPLSLPSGCVFYIKDAYIDCECELVQVLNKSRLMYVFKKLSDGCITTYTNVSLKDAEEINFIQNNTYKRRLK